ncbi:MAG: hypothetical protein ACKPCI_04925, partial [Dolichospermum sp.]
TLRDFADKFDTIDALPDIHTVFEQLDFVGLQSSDEVHGEPFFSGNFSEFGDKFLGVIFTKSRFKFKLFQSC